MRNPSQEGRGASRLVGHSEASTPKLDISPTSNLHAVDVFADWCTAAERPLRIRIHKARDRMVARANRSKHGRARAFYWLGAQLASDWVFARADAEDLQEILAALSRTFLTAQMIERLEAPDE